MEPGMHIVLTLPEEVDLRVLSEEEFLTSLSPSELLHKVFNVKSTLLSESLVEVANKDFPLSKSQSEYPEIESATPFFSKS